MVKRLLSVVAAVMLATMLNAQETPLTWAYVYDEPSDWAPLGTGAVGVSFSVAYKVPSTGDLKGASIAGIKIPVADPGMTNASVWIKNDLNGDDVVRKEANGPFEENTFFPVMLDESVAIPEGGFYVGYTFTNSIAYCLPTGSVAFSNGLLISVDGSDFDDYSSQFGASSTQLLVTDVQIPDYELKLQKYTGINTAVNTPFTVTVPVTGKGKKTVNSIDYTVDINGVVTSSTYTFDKPMEPSFSYKGNVEITATSPDELGAYTVKVTLDKVNGEDVAVPSSISVDHKTVTKQVSRRTVVEEFTGTACGWCPRGWAGMERLKKTYPEDFIGIAFHKYNTSDPMYVGNYFPTSSLGITGAPGCNMNRLKVMDPYYGTYDGIWNDLERFNAFIPEVGVSVKGTWDEDQKKVTVDAQVEALSNGSSFSLAYVLTADSLTGTTNAWKQINYYNYQYGQFSSEYDLPEDLRFFYNNGDIYSTGSQTVVGVSLVFDDVMIGSSYNTTGKNIADNIEGADNTVAGNVYEGSYTITMPTKTTLKNAIDNDKVYAVVLVVDNKTGEILNAAKAKVEAADIPEGITTANAAEEAVEVARYTIDGKLTAAPQRGLNLVRMSDGRVVKMIVK